MRTLVVTGASGYIGRHLVAAGRAAGWRMVAATRLPMLDVDGWFPYRLEDEIASDAIPRDAVIVHLAAQTGAGLKAGVDVRAADRLIERSRQRGARLLFVSSQTARSDAPTPYGRTKWAIEQRVVAAGGTAVRPGLVYGGSPGGVYAALLRLLRKHAVLPSLVPAPQVQPVHVEDLAQVLLHLAACTTPPSVVRVAAAEPVAMDEFFRMLATGRGLAVPRFVPVPRVLAPIGATALDAIGARTLAMRIRSLVDLPPMQTDDAAITGMVLRPLAQGVEHRSRSRRAIAAEGMTMLRYVLGRPPTLPVLRRYARAVEQRDARALALPPIVHRWPPLLRALDQNRWLVRRPELDWRFGAAIAIAEASPEGALRFLRLTHPARAPAALLRVAGIGVLEGVAGLVGWPLRAAMRRDPRD